MKSSLQSEGFEFGQESRFLCFMIFTRICGRFALSFKTDVEYKNLTVEDQKNYSEKLPSNRQGGRSYESRASSCRRFQVVPAFRFEPLVAKAVYPRSRSWLREAMDSLNISAPQTLLTKCLGLSLSDQYWVRPVQENVSWESVNFFQSPFSRDVGDILFGGKADSKDMDLMSPDNTSDGWLKKRWSILDGKRCLIKGGSGTTRQEPYNEVLASWIMEQSFRSPMFPIEC